MKIFNRAKISASSEISFSFPKENIDPVYLLVISSLVSVHKPKNLKSYDFKQLIKFECILATCSRCNVIHSPNDGHLFVGWVRERGSGERKNKRKRKNPKMFCK